MLPGRRGGAPRGSRCRRAHLDDSKDRMLQWGEGGPVPRPRSRSTQRRGPTSSEISGKAPHTQSTASVTTHLVERTPRAGFLCQRSSRAPQPRSAAWTWLLRRQGCFQRQRWQGPSPAPRQPQPRVLHCPRGHVRWAPRVLTLLEWGPPHQWFQCNLMMTHRPRGPRTAPRPERHQLVEVRTVLH